MSCCNIKELLFILTFCPCTSSEMSTSLSPPSLSFCQFLYLLTSFGLNPYFLIIPCGAVYQYCPFFFFLSIYLSCVGPLGFAFSFLYEIYRVFTNGRSSNNSITCFLYNNKKKNAYMHRSRNTVFHLSAIL